MVEAWSPIHRFRKFNLHRSLCQMGVFIDVTGVRNYVSIVWFKMIVQTVTRALINGYSDDVRSDEDGEEAEETVEMK